MADIQHSIPIAAKPEAIYPLIATAQGLAQWWAEDVTEPAGAVELGFFKRTTVYRLRLNADEPGVRTEWTCETGAEWTGTRIAFRLEPRGATTQVYFTHGDWAAA